MVARKSVGETQAMKVKAKSKAEGSTSKKRPKSPDPSDDEDSDDQEAGNEPNYEIRSDIAVIRGDHEDDTIEFSRGDCIIYGPNHAVGMVLSMAKVDAREKQKLLDDFQKLKNVDRDGDKDKKDRGDYMDVDDKNEEELKRGKRKYDKDKKKPAPMKSKKRPTKASRKNKKNDSSDEEDDTEKMDDDDDQNGHDDNEGEFYMCRVRKFVRKALRNTLFVSDLKATLFDMHDNEVIQTSEEELVCFTQIHDNCSIENPQDFFSMEDERESERERALNFFCRRAFNESEGRRTFCDINFDYETLLADVLKNWNSLSALGGGVGRDRANSKESNMNSFVIAAGDEDDAVAKCVDDDHEDEELPTEELLKMPRWYQSFIEARSKLLPSGAPPVLPCRQSEKSMIWKFLERNLNTGRTAQLDNIMFVAGLPGTGKTACVSEVLKVCEKLGSPQENADFLECFFNSVGHRPSQGLVEACKSATFITSNCLKAFGPYSLYVDIYLQLKNTRKRPIPRQALKEVEKLYAKRDTMEKKVILFLDEMDALRPQLMYRILEWTLQYPNAFTLITISNTLDLPERMAAKIYSRLKAERLKFHPYRFPQLKEIMLERVGKLVFEEQAATMCACRVATETGDVRKALKVCRAALDRKILDNKKHVMMMFEICKHDLMKKDNLSEEQAEETYRKLSETEILQRHGQYLIMRTPENFKQKPFRPNMDKTKVSIVDIDKAEVAVLRPNPTIDLISQLPFSARNLLISFLHVWEASRNTGLPYIAMRDVVRQMILFDSSYGLGRMSKDEIEEEFSAKEAEIRSSGVFEKINPKYQKAIEKMRAKCSKGARTAGVGVNARDSITGTKTAEDDLRIADSIVQAKKDAHILLYTGVLCRTPPRESSANLKMACRLVSGSNKSIHDAGARDLMGLAHDIGPDDIRYALSRAKCSIAKRALGLDFFEGK